MTKDIKFGGYDAKKSEIECIDGQIEAMYRNAVDIDGSVTGAIALEHTARVPHSYRLIAVHKTNDGPNVILANSQSVRDEQNAQVPNDADANISTISREEGVYFAPFSEVIEESDLHHIDSFSEILAINIHGDVITLSTTDGIVHMMWSTTPENHYKVIRNSTEIICIDFGLKKAGNLSTADTVIVKNESLGYATASTGASGSGASRPHPTANGLREDTQNISKAVLKCYDKAIVVDVTSKGYLHQPFFVRYALRLADGTYIQKSAPILMLPTVLPPRIGVNTLESNDDKTTLSIDLSRNKYFELRYRVRRAAAAQWKEMAASVDIFITPPIATYDESEKEFGYITSISDVLAGSDNGGTHRGRQTSRATDDIFEGHYAEGDDNYTEHTLAEITDGSGVWFVAANHHLYDDVAVASEFYKVASIPCDELMVSDEFKSLQLITTDPNSIARHTKLEDHNTSHNIVAEAIHWQCGRMVVASTRHRLSPPYPLSAMAAFAGRETGGASANITLKVYVKSIDSDHLTVSVSQGHQLALTQHFPRYLFYPDKNAYKMTLTQNGISWTIKLKPHERLEGAYWWHGFGNDEPSTTDADVEAEDMDNEVVTSSQLYISAEGCGVTLIKAVDTGIEKIVRLTNALTPPAQGSFGDYPLYAFSGDGVWLIQYDDKHHNVGNIRKITEYGCDNAEAITTMDGKIAYMSKGSIMMIDGSKITDISKATVSKRFDLHRLPNIEDIVQKLRINPEEITVTEPEQTKALTYDKDRGWLIAAGQSTVIYDTHSEIWVSADISLSGKVAGSETLVIDIYGNAGRLVIDEAESYGLLLTRTMKINQPIEARVIKSMELLGEYRQHHVMTALYASNDLCHWHLAGNAKGGFVENYNGQGYRYYRLLVAAKLDRDEFLYGIQAIY